MASTLNLHDAFNKSKGGAAAGAKVRNAYNRHQTTVSQQQHYQFLSPNTSLSRLSGSLVVGPNGYYVHPTGDLANYSQHPPNVGA